MNTWRAMRLTWIGLTVAWLPAVVFAAYVIVAYGLDLSPFPRTYLLDLENGTFGRQDKPYVMTPAEIDPLTIEKRLTQHTALQFEQSDGALIIVASESRSRYLLPDPDSVHIRRRSIPGLFSRKDYRVFTVLDDPAAQELASYAYQRYLYFNPQPEKAIRWLKFVSFLALMLFGVPTLLTFSVWSISALSSLITIRTASTVNAIRRMSR